MSLDELGRYFAPMPSSCRNLRTVSCRHRPVTGVRNHAELRTGDRPEHLDGVLRRDDVVVADDEECGRLDALQSPRS